MHGIPDYNFSHLQCARHTRSKRLQCRKCIAYEIIGAEFSACTSEKCLDIEVTWQLGHMALPYLPDSFVKTWYAHRSLLFAAVCRARGSDGMGVRHVQLTDDPLGLHALSLSLMCSNVFKYEALRSSPMAAANSTCNDQDQRKVPTSLTVADIAGNQHTHSNSIWQPAHA